MAQGLIQFADVPPQAHFILRPLVGRLLEPVGVRRLAEGAEQVAGCPHPLALFLGEEQYGKCEIVVQGALALAELGDPVGLVERALVLTQRPRDGPAKAVEIGHP